MNGGDAHLHASPRPAVVEDRPIAGADTFTEIAYYLCCSPTGTSDDELIRVAGARWAVEDCVQTAKTEVGLDHDQVRRYDDAWYRHITLAMLAHTYLAHPLRNPTPSGTRDHP
jgi:SRSO17 transposase